MKAYVVLVDFCPRNGKGLLCPGMHAPFEAKDRISILGNGKPTFVFNEYLPEFFEHRLKINCHTLLPASPRDSPLVDKHSVQVSYEQPARPISHQKDPGVG